MSVFIFNKAKAFEWPEWLNKPIYSNDDDNIRHKRLLVKGIGLAYQLSNYDAKSSNGISSQWDNTSNLGLDTDLIINITDRLWFRWNGAITVLFAGDAILVNNGASSFLSGPVGTNGDAQLVIGYDIARFSKIDIGLYGGLYKGGSINYASSGNSNMYVENLWLGGVLGTNLTYYAEDMINILFAEYYITYLVGDQSAHQNGSAYNSSFANSIPAMGFGIGGSTEIKVSGNFWVKPFAKFQAMFAGALSGTYDTAAGSVIASNLGTANFEVMTVGVDLNWR